VDRKLSTEKLAMYYFADVYSNVCYLLFLDYIQTHSNYTIISYNKISLDKKIKFQNRLGLRNKTLNKLLLNQRVNNNTKGN